MSDMLVEFRLRNGGTMTLDAVQFDGPTITGCDRQGKTYTLDKSSVVAERLIRDEHGRVGGKRKRG